MARNIVEAFASRSAVAEWIDLRETLLPSCDGGDCYDDPKVIEMSQKIREAESVVLATPIYNYAASASAKNLIELTGSAWQDQIVGFLCAAGGASSYMAIMGLANTLMLDFRSIVVPRFVYAEDAAFNDETIVDENLKKRLDELAGAMIYYSNALHDRSQ